MAAITDSPSDQSTKDYRANSLFRLTLRRIFRQRSAIIGGTILLFLVFVAIFAPVLAPFDPDFVLIGHEEGIKRRTDPCIHILGCPKDQPQHILGTDGNVRDEFSRVIFGTRVSLFIGFTTVGFAIIIGTLLGALGGFLGGWVDNLIMRVMDAMMSIPLIIMALFLGGVLGKGLGNIVLSLGIVLIPGYARLTRGQVMSLKQLDYITAATIGGASRFNIAVKHILPNSLSPNLVLMTMNLA